jgi:hypothetical protein
MNVDFASERLKGLRVLKFSLFLTLVTLLGAVALPAANRQVTYQGDIHPLNITPTFDHGYLIVWDRNTDGTRELKTISVYGPTGSRIYQAAIQVPKHKHLFLLNAAADVDGTVAVVFREPGGFAVLNRNGMQIQTVVTDSYIPTQICFAPDHTIWLAGSSASGAEYMMFRKYSPDGRELGRFVSSSTFASRLAPIECIGGRAMQASANGIVALLQPQPTPDSGLRWVELDFQGKLVGEFGQHKDLLPWTLTPNGTIYAREDVGKFVFLDRASGTWKQSSIARPGYLAGADENGLIFGLPDQITLEWVPVSQ